IDTAIVLQRYISTQQIDSLKWEQSDMPPDLRMHG
ncbi:unnamed protein product, partial [Onchocerca ochengi]